MPKGTEEYNKDYMHMKRYLVFNRALRLHSKKIIQWPELTHSQICILLILSYKGPCTVNSMNVHLAFLNRDAKEFVIRSNFKVLMANELVAMSVENKRKPYMITVVGRNYLASVEKYLKNTRLDK